MSATAQTGNYHLPIYEAGNLANYMVDWNGAMNTIDAAMNVNHMDSDKLKTDFEAIETEFQQVKTESSGAATAATQAQTDAARAITIANNATTVAGDAQVDAHAALTQIEKLTTEYDVKTLAVGPSYGALSIQFPAFGYSIQGYVKITKNSLTKIDNNIVGGDLYGLNNTLLGKIPKILSAANAYSHIAYIQGLFYKIADGNIDTALYSVYNMGFYTDANSNASIGILLPEQTYNLLESRLILMPVIRTAFYSPLINPLSLLEHVESFEEAFNTPMFLYK